METSDKIKEKTDLLIQEAKYYIFLFGFPTLSCIVLGILLSSWFYMNDIVNASMLMANMISIGCFYSFYTISFKFMNKLFWKFSK